jgi:hypothetical protein
MRIRRLVTNSVKPTSERDQVQEDHHVLAAVFQPDQLVEGLRAFDARRARHLEAEHRRLRNARDAVRAARQVGQVVREQADDFAEAERDDRQIVAAQPQHREAEQEAEGRRGQRRDRQALPERQPEILVEHRVGIAADRVEPDVAEIEQAREADHDVQPEAEDHVDQRERRDVHRAARAEERPHEPDREQHPDDRALLRAPIAGAAGSFTADFAHEPRLEQLEQEHGATAIQTGRQCGVSTT